MVSAPRLILLPAVPFILWAGCRFESRRPISSPPSIRLAAVGDIMLGRGVSRRSNNAGSLDYPFRKVAAFLNSHEAVFGNLEAPLTAGGTRQQKGFTFRASPGFALRLKKSGFSVLALANNHALDFGPQGLAETAKNLDDAGIGVSGIAEQDGSCRLLVTVSEGIRIGWLAYCDRATDGFLTRRGPSSPDIALLDQKIMESDIRAALRQADLVIVSLHWGREYSGAVSESQRRLARRAIEEGACLVLGHHPHVLQGIEIWRHGLIVYSLGNFIFDQTTKERNESVLLQATIQECGVAEARILPIQIRHSQPRITTGTEGRPILERIASLSAELGTKIAVDSAPGGSAVGHVLLPHRKDYPHLPLLDRPKIGD